MNIDFSQRRCKYCTDSVSEQKLEKHIATRHRDSVLDDAITEAVPGSDEQINLIVLKFQLEIQRYLKHGYWRYVEEQLRTAITKALGRWPGQKHGQ